MKNILMLFVLLVSALGCSTSSDVNSQKKETSTNFKNSFDARIYKNASK